MIKFQATFAGTTFSHPLHKAPTKATIIPCIQQAAHASRLPHALFPLATYFTPLNEKLLLILQHPNLIVLLCEPMFKLCKQSLPTALPWYLTRNTQSRHDHVPGAGAGLGRTSGSFIYLHGS